MKFCSCWNGGRKQCRTRSEQVILHLQVTPQAYTGVIVEQVVKFSDQFCTPASFTVPEDHPANYTGSLLASISAYW